MKRVEKEKKLEKKQSQKDEPNQKDEPKPKGVNKPVEGKKNKKTKAKIAENCQRSKLPGMA